MSANKIDQDNVTHSLKDEHAPKEGGHDEAAEKLEELVNGSETNHEGHVGVSPHKKGWVEWAIDGITSLTHSSDNVKGTESGDANLLSSSSTMTTDTQGWGSWIFSSLLSSVLPTGKKLQDDWVKWKMGNYVAIRGTDKTIFEAMPTYVRVGMHLLFYGSKKTSLLRYGKIENVLTKMTEKEGAIYDDEKDTKAVQEFIQNFIKTYEIDINDLLETDLTKYPSRNSFFYRKLKPNVRPIAEIENTKLVSSAADCRLTVFPSSKVAKEIWIKGKQFSIKELINEKESNVNSINEDSSLAIFRLAPADYHRYNHPVGPVKIKSKIVSGQEFYTVNPDAVNEDFDVFTGNRRGIAMMEWTPENTTYKIAFVSVGALLVGSNRYTGAEEGQTYQRGDEMGYFAYGGSTVIAVIPSEAKIKWDDDLAANSLKGLETLVKVGERIGVSQA